MIVDKKFFQGGITKLIFENFFSSEKFCLLVKLTLKYASLF